MMILSATLSPILISVIGAISAILVSVFGATSANRNNIKLQTRKLKEDHYVAFIEALHNFTSDNKNVEVLENYLLARDKILIIASEEVIRKILLYEELYDKEVEKANDLHDSYLTNLIKAIRNDLNIIDKSFLEIGFKKA